tara:strand:- start:1592 stop:1960 length:369 start_codon:yes stop_codon:yes gene_type:complete
MANNVVKVNGIAIANIAKLNGITDANLAKLNGEEFTGTFPNLTWTAGGAMSAGRAGAHGFGASLSAVVMAGGDGPDGGATLTSSEEYNGTSWGSGGAMSTSSSTGGSAGTLTSGLVMGGWNA